MGWVYGINGGTTPEFIQHKCRIFVDSGGSGTGGLKIVVPIVVTMVIIYTFTIDNRVAEGLSNRSPATRADRTDAARRAAGTISGISLITINSGLVRGALVTTNRGRSKSHSCATFCRRVGDCVDDTSITIVGRRAVLNNDTFSCANCPVFGAP